MKKLLFLIMALSIAQASENLEEEIFSLSEEQDILLSQMIAEEICDFEEEFSQSLSGIELGDFEEEDLPLFGLKFEEEATLLIPWSDKEITTPLEKQGCKEPVQNLEQYSPSFESVPKRKHYFALRPRVVPSKEKEKKSLTNKMQSNNGEKEKKIEPKKKSLKIITNKLKKPKGRKRQIIKRSH